MSYIGITSITSPLVASTFPKIYVNSVKLVQYSHCRKNAMQAWKVYDLSSVPVSKNHHQKLTGSGNSLSDQCSRDKEGASAF
jgi:hypothetical protein